ncbi:hypothetical protein BC828DRAFT_436226, partial [Blastocladiella britannica]
MRVRGMPQKLQDKLAKKRHEVAWLQLEVTRYESRSAELSGMLAHLQANPNYRQAAKELAQVRQLLAATEKTKNTAAAALTKSQASVLELEQDLAAGTQAAAEQAATDQAAAELAMTEEDAAAERNNDSGDDPMANQRYPMPNFGNPDVANIFFRRVVAGSADRGGKGACRSVKHALADFQFYAGGCNSTFKSAHLSKPIKERGN